jgi:hypothetical protein
LFAKHATKMHVTMESLFDMGRPKPVCPRWHIWENTFFVVRFCVVREFSVAHWEAGRIGCPEYTDEAGEHHEAVAGRPAAIVPFLPHTMTLTIEGPHFGLKDWKVKHAEILAVADTFGAKDLKLEFLQQVSKADDEVARWEKAIADAVVTIPEPTTGATP